MNLFDRDDDSFERFDAVSPLDYRYYGDDRHLFRRLRPYVSEHADIRYLLRVEATLARMLARWNVCSPEIARKIETACREVTSEEVYLEEKRVEHNVRAVVNCIRRRISPESRPYVHLFATSADIMDTAASLRYKELVRDVLLPDLIALEELLIGLARKNKQQVQIGRTHGQHAVPITFGFALALYVSRIGSRIQKIDGAHRNLRGKFSGAVGAFNAISLLNGGDPSFYEHELLAELGLKPSDTSISSQIVEPEFLADLIYAVVTCFSVLANLADDVRHLMRSEIGELVDVYRDQVVGSSTMPHKINPKNFENVKSLWKEFMPRMVTVFMDQISEHQRDLTNSASARFVPEILVGFCYAITRMTDALKKMDVRSARMKENVDVSRHHVVAEPLYIMLALQGYPDAYDAVMRLAREAKRQQKNLVELLRQDPDLSARLDRLPEAHKQLLADPAIYTGDAVTRTEVTCDHWELICDSTKRLLAAEAEAQHPPAPLTA